MCNTVGPFVKYGPEVAEACAAAGAHYQYVKVDPLAKWDVVVPGQHELGLAVPWGGTSHPIWFKNDPRVAR